MLLGLPEITEKIRVALPMAVRAVQADGLQPWIEVNENELYKLISFLRNDPDFYLDFLASLSGVDDSERLWVVYHLCSIPYGHRLVIKVALDRNKPVVDSICNIYAAANWHEREAYDLYGIEFRNHPDLRRILLPEDWQGHPMRKDYEAPERYHDIDIAY